MKIKTFLRAIASLGLVYCSIASASSLDDAWGYYDQSNFGKAAETFRAIKPTPTQALGALCGMAVTKKAISDSKSDLQYCKDGVAANDSYAIVLFGWANLYGNEWLGLQKNPTLGLGYLGKAAIDNFPLASEVLCDYFYRESKFSRAAPFCKVAAASNMSRGLYYMALMNLNGKGTVQDFEKGRNFALLSASLDLFDAYMLLGDISKTGSYGQQKDLVAAYAWYALAGAAAPDSDAPNSIRNALGLDSAKITEAQKIAGKWKKSGSQKWRDMYKPSPAAVAQVSAAPAVVVAAPVAVATVAPTTGVSNSVAPSFDCTKATSPAERLICSDSDLSKLDVDLNAIFADVRKSATDKKQVRADQLAWMKNSRNACSDKQCMVKAYKQRITDLTSSNK